MPRYTNKYGLPEEFYKYRKFKPYSKGDADISVTGLIKPPIQRVLEEVHDDEIEIDVIDQMWALWGTAIHEVLATGSGMMDISEERLSTKINGWEVSGAIDLQTGKRGTIIRDYKVTTVFGFRKARDEIEDHPWTKQLNSYAFLVEEDKGIPVIGVELFVVMRDWSARMAENGKNEYPNAPIMKITPPLWSMDERRQYLEHRVELHQQANSDHALGMDIDVCSPTDRWKQPFKYAIYTKPGNTKAAKVCETREEAEEYVRDKQYDNAYIEQRGGEDVRCLSFCNVRQWCPHGSKLEDDA